MFDDKAFIANMFSSRQCTVLIFGEIGIDSAGPDAVIVGGEIDAGSTRCSFDAVCRTFCVR